MSEMTEMQRACHEWLVTNFGVSEGPAALERRCLVLAEETGEVCRAVVKRADGIRGSHEQWTAEIRKEMGDVLFVLLTMAELEGFDLLHEAKLRLAEIIGRSINHDPIVREMTTRQVIEAYAKIGRGDGATDLVQYCERVLAQGDVPRDDILRAYALAPKHLHDALMRLSIDVRWTDG